MNNSTTEALLQRFYLDLIYKYNLSHLLVGDMSINQLSSLLEENFPWPPDMLFTSANMISIAVYCLQLVVGLASNFYSLFFLLRERLILHNKNRMVLLLIHLTCADLCVSRKFKFCQAYFTRQFQTDLIIFLNCIKNFRIKSS